MNAPDTHTGGGVERGDGKRGQVESERLGGGGEMIERDRERWRRRGREVKRDARRS